MRLPLIVVLSTGLALTACGPSNDAATPTVPTATPVEAVPADSGEPTVLSLPAEAQAQLDQYAADAEAMVAAVDGGADTDALSAAAQSLMDQAMAILPAYLSVRPECSEYLTAAAGVTEGWADMTPDEIERDYHRDEALPKSDATAACYHFKDLIVHPATALSLLAQPDVDLEKVREEIHEVAVHAQVVKQQP